MPPFGPRKFEVPLTDEEKALATERKANQNDLYARLKALVAGRTTVDGRISPSLTFERSVEAEYQAEGQADDETTQAKAETGIGVSEHPYVTIYTREVREPSDEDVGLGPWIGQLTLRPVDDEAQMYDCEDGARTWTDREAIEILKAGVDTASIIEAAAQGERGASAA
jgi:hypothetical protein